MKGSFPFPPFQFWKQINIQEAFCNIVFFWGGGGGDYRWKRCFHSNTNTMVSSKALVLVNCVNTFVHDCCFSDRIKSFDLEDKFLFAWNQQTLFTWKIRIN